MNTQRDNPFSDPFTQTPTPIKLTIRVYGLLIHHGSLLISREQYKGVDMFKFPGGGMEQGEGVLDTLKREWQEELGVEVEGLEQLYTTDFHTKSTFDPEVQVISIYYRVAMSGKDMEKLCTDEKGTVPQNKKESFQWYTLEELSEDHFTFETEKAAFRKLLSVFNY